MTTKEYNSLTVTSKPNVNNMIFSDEDRNKTSSIRWKRKKDEETRKKRERSREIEERRKEEERRKKRKKRGREERGNKTFKRYLLFDSLRS